MHLATIYTTPSSLKPSLLVDTIFNSKTKETAVRFCDALNNDHARELVYEGSQDKSRLMYDSGWIVIQRHETLKAAVDYHLDLTCHFHNGGSVEEWNEGWEPYLRLYEAFCPEKRE